MNTKIYAGIGSRLTPQTVLDAMTQVATKLRKEKMGAAKRSGAHARQHKEESFSKKLGLLRRES